MRYTLLMAIVILGLASCKKDKFTTAPQISYKSLKPNVVQGNIPLTGQYLPVLTFSVTDAEGDLGFKDGSDSAYIYIKNLLSNTRDSFKFPDLSGVRTKNFKFDVDVTINTANLIKGGARPRPKTDTLYFEVYIKDIARNKSNTITTLDPVYFIVP